MIHKGGVKMLPTIAIIGSGVSGLTAAYLLRKTHEVTLFESENRFGGHSHTHAITGSDGKVRNIDSGFIVHNDRTYPNLIRIFNELGIQTQQTEMSMSINCKGCGLQYAGGRGLPGIAAQPWKLLTPKFLKLLINVPRFHKAAHKLLVEGNSDLTWGEFLIKEKFDQYFINHFAIPLVSCVWSSGDSDSLEYPALHLFEFLNHHGLLSIKNSPTWRTIVGGSQMYVAEILKLIPNKRSEKVSIVSRSNDGVLVNGEKFDYAIIATHADDALKILSDATPDEKSNLAAVGYSTNKTQLHSDSSVMPKVKGAKASWNYLMNSCNDEKSSVIVSYWMNKLMRLDGADQYFVTLNSNQKNVLAEMNYTHPIFTKSAVTAAKKLRSAGGERLAFAGAHLGWGFHEDGAKSGIDAAKKFGAKW
jgi:predicted NAD/FAD-binding protein